MPSIVLKTRKAGPYHSVAAAAGGGSGVASAAAGGSGVASAAGAGPCLSCSSTISHACSALLRRALRSMRLPGGSSLLKSLLWGKSSLGRSYDVWGRCLVVRLVMKVLYCMSHSWGYLDSATTCCGAAWSCQQVQRLFVYCTAWEEDCKDPQHCF